MTKQAKTETAKLSSTLEIAATASGLTQRQAERKADEKQQARKEAEKKMPPHLGYSL